MFFFRLLPRPHQRICQICSRSVAATTMKVMCWRNTSMILFSRTLTIPSITGPVSSTLPTSQAKFPWSCLEVLWPRWHWIFFPHQVCSYFHGITVDWLILSATSTDVEWLFSHGGLNVTKQRHALSVESTIDQTVLNSWVKCPGLVDEDELTEFFNNKSKRPNNGGKKHDVVAIDE